MDGQATPVTWQAILDVVKGPLVQNNALDMKIYQVLKHESDKQLIGTSKFKIYALNCLTEWYDILVDVKPEQHVRESTGSECPQEKGLARNEPNISENTGKS